MNGRAIAGETPAKKLYIISRLKKTMTFATEVLKQVERRLSQQGRVLVISRSNNLAVFLGTSICQALAADDSMEQQTVVIPEGISRGKQKLS